MRSPLSSLIETPIRALKFPRGWDIRLSPRFLAYSPSFEIEVETTKYSLKTAKSMKELLNVFELRYQCFLEENDESKISDGYDLDEFDGICDHIIIKSKEENKVVGTYRVISGLFSEDFYSQTEFSLDKFLMSEGEKLELGRACIHHAHRNGHVIDLLWRGIAEYIKLTNTKYLFGCSSIKTIDPRLTKGLVNYFQEEGHTSQSFDIRPLPSFDMNLGQVKMEESDPKTLKEAIPPLLRSYFSAGSKLHSAPALDKEFKCIDFLTIADVTQLNPSYKKRYFR